jgi:dTMP kinase
VAEGGCFLALEGGEGAGKTTQAALLGAWLDGLGVEHVLAREPGGTGVGEAVRSLVLGRTDLDVPPRSELFLILAARAAFVDRVVRPALESGAVVVADRFALSTLAYQGYGRGLPLDEIRAANRVAAGHLSPDLYLVLDVEVARGADRQRLQGKEPDRMEGAGEPFLERVRQGYLELARREPNVRVLSGEGSPEEVHRRIRRLLQAELPETFGAAAV